MFGKKEKGTEVWFMRLKEIRESKKISQSKVAKIIGVEQSTYSLYENGKRALSSETLSQLANFFGVTIDYILEIDNCPQVEELIKYDVIGTITAGYNGIAEEEPTGEQTYIPKEYLKGRKKQDYFALRVKGDSMYPKFLDGDIVLVLRCSSVDSGSTACVLYNGDEATIKIVKYISGEDWIDLIPINPEYKSKRIQGEQLKYCMVLGKVTKLIRDI